MLINDQNQRTKALDHQSSFIIQAPAGSGKTELLTQRFLKLLAHIQNAPEEILAITFTRKAAKEMHQRIYKSLIFAHYHANPPTEEHKKLTWDLAREALINDAKHGWNILNNPQRLRITTIDAFCQNLTKKMPILSSMTQNPEVMDNSDSLYEIAIQALIKNSGQDAPWHHDFCQLLKYVDNNIPLLTQLIKNMLARREQWMPLLIGNDVQTLKETLEQNFQSIICTQLTMIINEMDGLDIQQWETLISFSQNTLHTKSELIDLSSHISSLTSWQHLIELAFTGKREPRKSVSIKQGFPAATQGKNAGEKRQYKQMKALHKEASEALSQNPTLQEKLLFIDSLNTYEFKNIQWDMLQHICQILKIASQYLQITFAQHNKVDFNEISLSAIAALGEPESPTDLALYLDHSIQHLLIDEFQDTSVTQFELLTALTQEWTPNDGHTLFLVGDPMQSIYRFREADVQRFLDVKLNGIGNIKPIPLTLECNFRSSENIIQWINQVFSSIFPKIENQNLGAISYAPSIATQVPSEDSYILQHGFSHKIEEAAFIAEKIKSLLKNKKQSIAILARSRSHLTQIIFALKAENIPYTENEIQPLEKLDIIRDLKSLTLSLLHSADLTAWVSLLRSPLIGMSLQDIQKIIQLGQNVTIYQNLKNISHDRSHPFHHKINILITPHQPQNLIGRNANLRDSIQRIWHALHATAIYPDSAQHYLRFLDLLDKHDQQGCLQERNNFLNELSMLKAEASNESNVHLMTLHKSKGLEFDSVFLPGLNSKTRSDDKSLLLHDSYLGEDSKEKLLLAPLSNPRNEQKDPLYLFLEKINKKRLHFEEQRLLYVAATRAKQRLILTATFSGKGEPTAIKSSLLQHLWHYCQPFWKIEIPIDTDDKKETAFIQPLIKRTTSTQILATISQSEAPQEATLNFPDTYRVGSYFDRHVGIALHAIFEVIQTEDFASHGKLINIELKKLLNAGFIAKEQAKAQKILNRALQNITHDPHAKWIFSHKKIALNEIHTHRIIQSGKLSEQILDRVFIDKDNICWVIDYKTSQPDAKETLSNFLQREKFAYIQQLKQYYHLMVDTFERPTKTALYFPLIPHFYEIDPLEEIVPQKLEQ